MNKVYYYGYEDYKNAFFIIQQKIIKDLGYEIINAYYSNLKEELIYKKPANSIIILNFVENGRGKGKRLIKYYLYWPYIFYLCHKNNNKFVFVYHNLEVHEASFIKKLMSNLVILFLKKRSDAIQLLSSNSISYIKKSYRKKSFVVPHINYIDVYGSLKQSDNNECLNLLFFGMIKKYKNIEMIIEIAKNIKNMNIKFVIRGNVSDDDYYNELVEMSKELNSIEIIPEFVPDNEVPDILSKCDALILPYKKNSCLNSGTAILAGSYQKTFICPLIATVKDMPQDLVYSYDYDNDKEHMINLQNAIIKMYNDKQNYPNILKEKGKQLQKYLIDNHSDLVVSNAYKKMFKYLENKGNQR